jgi:hypothetical protein
MTKNEVLKDVSSLMEKIDECTWTIISAAHDRDIEAVNAANVRMQSLMVDAHQELTFLYDYIVDNVKE